MWGATSEAQHRDMNFTDMYYAQSEVDFRRERATTTIRRGRRRWPRTPGRDSASAGRSRSDT